MTKEAEQLQHHLTSHRGENKIQAQIITDVFDRQGECGLIILLQKKKKQEWVMLA